MRPSKSKEVFNMAGQQRSAERLVNKIFGSRQLQQDLNANPQGTLEKLRDEVVKELPPPDPPTINAIWLIIVSALVVVVVGSTVVLAIGVFSKIEAGATYLTKSETILTLFTTALALLGGLLAPSPIKK
jgi:hypothetical protein